MDTLKQSRRFKGVSRFMLAMTLWIGLSLGLNSILVSAQTVTPSSQFYVTDRSNVLNQSVSNHILSINQQFEKTIEKPQIAVVTIPTLDGMDIETFAVEQFESMALGNKDYDNGVLILLATEDREIRIEVGYGLEGILNDAKVGRILDASMNELRVGSYSQAMKDIFNQVVLQVQQEYGYEDALNGQVPMVSEEVEENGIWFTVVVVVGVMIYFGACKMMGLSTFEALYLLSAFTNSSNSSRTSSSRSSGGGGRSGGGGASRNF
ncbi:MAG TPA: hypothetical protein DCY20_02660 [Firmicutes bacterium]|nr:hypothetical protein [Bacillota bacterium]